MDVSLEPLEPRRLLSSTYYVSTSGNDKASGLSPANAFRSIARVNQLDLNPGDRVLFQGGKTFGVSGSDGANVLQNSGFESGLTHWTDTLGSASANASISTSAHGGSGALKLSGSGTAIRAQDVTSALTANQTYEMSAFTRATSIGPGNRRIGITFYLKGKQVATYYKGFAATSWAQASWEFVSPPAFDDAKVWVSRKGDDSAFYADDLSLKSIPNGIILNSFDAGTVIDPVIIASYGSGKAAIYAGDGIGFWGGNVAGVSVQNLKFEGTWNAATGSGANAGVGIEFANTLADNTQLQFVTIEKCQAVGFEWGGVRVGGWNAKSGYNTVLITDTITRDNGDVGILIRGEFDAGSALYANTKVYVARCTAYNNTGIPDKYANSGSGIQMTDTIYGTVERCVAYNNGALNNYSGGGPVGIWAFDASRITLQYDESYGNHTASTLDGAGFDLDGGVNYSVIQNVYSHDNDGAGILLVQSAGMRMWGHNTVRYNISQNDARKNNYGAITLTGSPGPYNVVIENNTLYVSPASGSNPVGILSKWAGTGVAVRNNIIQTTGGVAPLLAASAGLSPQFNGNDYWTSGSAFDINWNGANYGSLSAWRGASGQEMIKTTATGLSVDPKLNSAGSAGALNDGYALTTLTQYQLAKSSLLINASAILSAAFSKYAPPDVDFFGVDVSGAKRSVGASQT